MLQYILLILNFCSRFWSFFSFAVQVQDVESEYGDQEEDETPIPETISFLESKDSKKVWNKDTVARFSALSAQSLVYLL